MERKQEEEEEEEEDISTYHDEFVDIEPSNIHIDRDHHRIGGENETRRFTRFFSRDNRNQKYELVPLQFENSNDERSVDREIKPNMAEDNSISSEINNPLHANDIPDSFFPRIDEEDIARRTPPQPSSHEDSEEMNDVEYMMNLRNLIFYHLEKKIILTSLVVFFIILMVLALPPQTAVPPLQETLIGLPDTIYIEDSYVNYPKFNFTIEKTQRVPFRLLLFGDSLIDYPSRNYNLKDMIFDLIQESIQSFEKNHSIPLLSTDRSSPLLQGQIPQFNLTISAHAKGGSTIIRLQHLLDSFIAMERYDGVLIFWDSDVSDLPNEYLMLNSTKDEYHRNVTALLTKIQQRIPMVSFAGPGLLGEGDIFRFPKFQGKEPLLNAYHEINQRIGKELSIPYMNIRKGFQELIPSYWSFALGIVTIDGEHPNYFGTQVIAKYFSTQFMKWYSVR